MPRNRIRAALITGFATLFAVLSAAASLAAEGNLSFVTCIQQSGGPSTCPGPGGVDGLAGVTGIAISPDGRNVYAAGQVSAGVAVFARDSTLGALSFVEVEKDGVDDPSDPGGTVDGLAGAFDVAVSPDGKSVYVTGGSDGSLAAFARNPTTGNLSFVEFEDDGVNDPSDPGGTVDGLAGASGVTVAPDGKHVYATGVVDSSVAAFTRDPITARLSFVEAEKDGVGGVDGLNAAEAVTVSPDGEHLYVAGFFDNAVAAFDRDPATGGLSFVEVEKDGVNDPSDPGGAVDGLAGARDVMVSADGKHAYATGFTDNAVAAFSRDSSTGRLSFVEFEKDGVNDATDPGGTVDGLAGATGTTLSPDRKHVYVTGSSDFSVVEFGRDPSTGRLSFVEFEKDGVNDPSDPGGTVDGLGTATEAAASPDGGHLYVTGGTDAAIAVFAREADLTAPDTISLAGPPATTADNTPTFTFDSNDPLFAAGFECRVDEGPFFPCSSPYTSFALADGPHRFQVRVTDTAGNTDPTPAEALFTVDTLVPPEPEPPAAVPPDATAPDTTAPDTELTREPSAQLTAKKKTAKASFEFAASEPGSRFECRLDSASFAACTSPQNLKLRKGPHTFRVRAIDAAGNADFSPAKWQGTVIKKKKSR